MKTAEVLYLIGLVTVVIYMLLGADDFFWDILCLFNRRSYQKKKVDSKKLDETPPKLLAFAVAAWH